MEEEKYPTRLKCPICSHIMEFIITRDAVINDLDRMFNVVSKAKVKEVIDSVGLKNMDEGLSVDDFCYRLKKELGLE